MREQNYTLRIVLTVLFLLSWSVPSWAWVRVGFRGPRVGVYLGPWPGWGYGPYDPYYDGPDDPSYYDPYAYRPYYVPYAYVLPGVAPQESRTGPDNSKHDLKSLNHQIARARAQADFELQDGDITKAEHDTELYRLVGIKKEALAEAQVNGGYITGDQEIELTQLLRSGGTASGSSLPRAPEDSHGGLKRIDNEISRIRVLLDKKLADGDITRAQHDGMRDYLARTEKQVHSDAAANDGSLTPDQENTVMKQLQRASDSLTKNFISN